MEDSAARMVKRSLLTMTARGNTHFRRKPFQASTLLEVVQDQDTASATKAAATAKRISFASNAPIMVTLDGKGGNAPVEKVVMETIHAAPSTKQPPRGGGEGPPPPPPPAKIVVDCIVVLMEFKLVLGKGWVSHGSDRP
jgi:hypothetical protein